MIVSHLAVQAVSMAPTTTAQATHSSHATSGNREQAVLVLADGTVLRGHAFGARGTVLGEVVFNTGMTGYQEVMTDPSYSGQLVTFTYPELGNTGVNAQDQEASHPHVRGVIARHLAPVASNWRSEEHLDRWLRRHGVVGISGVDTRALVRHLREGGAINGGISSDGTVPLELLERVRAAPLDGWSEPGGHGDHRRALHLDEPVRSEFRYPHPQPAAAALPRGGGRLRHQAGHPRPIGGPWLRSDGGAVPLQPGSNSCPSPRGGVPLQWPRGSGGRGAGHRAGEIPSRSGDLPLFGICMGHQILGLALGGSTFKLAYGHRGLNHPCGSPGEVEITSQNHGFALDADSLPADRVEVTHLNLNDRTVAALAVRDQPIFGVQYHPEASPGPHDADHHFQRFASFMEERRP
jgi:carbamoyl-phosphate synthase small subunit